VKLLRAFLLLAVAPLALGFVVVTYQDATLTHIPARAVIAQELREGRLPYVHPGASCGQPLLGNPNFGVFFPDTLLAAVLPLDVAFGLRFALILVLAFWGARRLARAEGASPEAAEVAAVAFVLSGVFLSTFRFFNSGLALAMAPFVLAAAARLVARDDASDASTRRRVIGEMAVFVGLEVLAGEPVIALLTFVLAAARVLVPLMLEKHRRAGLEPAALALAGAFLVGGLIAAPQIAATAQILGDSSRERKPIPFVTATGTSVHPVRLLEQVVPFPYGRPDVIGPEGFRGHAYFENHAPYLWTLHVGLVVLALLALHGAVPTVVLRLLAGSAFAAVVLSLGRHLIGAKLLYPLLSLGGRIRFPVKWWFVVALALVPLVALAALRWAGSDRPTLPRRAAHALLVAVGAVVLAIAWPSTPAAYVGPLLSLALASSLPYWPRKPALLGAALVASLLTSAGPLLLALLDRPPARPRTLGGGRIYSRIEADAHPIDPPTTNTPVRELFRRAPVELWPLTATRAGDGYAFDFDPDGAYADEDRAIRKALETLPWAERATELRLANVTTVVTDQELAEPYQLAAVLDPARGVRAYTLAGASPRVRLATRVLRAPDLAGVLAAHRDPSFDPANDTVLEGPGTLHPKRRESQVMVRDEQPSRLVVDLETESSGVLVWSQTFFSAWKARRDGRPAPVVRADGHLIGVEVPKGRSRVEIAWDTRPVHLGLGLCALGLLMVVALRREPRPPAPRADVPR